RAGSPPGAPVSAVSAPGAAHRPEQEGGRGVVVRRHTGGGLSRGTAPPGPPAAAVRGLTAARARGSARLSARRVLPLSLPAPVREPGRFALGPPRGALGRAGPV